MRLMKIIQATQVVLSIVPLFWLLSFLGYQVALFLFGEIFFIDSIVYVLLLFAAYYSFWAWIGLAATAFFLKRKAIPNKWSCLLIGGAIVGIAVTFLINPRGYLDFLLG